MVSKCSLSPSCMSFILAAKEPRCSSFPVLLWSFTLVGKTSWRITTTARVYLQLQDCDVRHLDVEREFCVPARIEPIIFDWLRRWLRVPLEVLVVTSQDHLGNYNFRLLYNVDDLAFKIGLRLYQKDLDVWVDNIIVNIKLSAATSWKVLTRDHLAYD